MKMLFLYVIYIFLAVSTSGYIFSAEKPPSTVQEFYEQSTKSNPNATPFQNLKREELHKWKIDFYESLEAKQVPGPKGKVPTQAPTKTPPAPTQAPTKAPVSVPKTEIKKTGLIQPPASTKFVKRTDIIQEQTKKHLPNVLSQVVGEYAKLTKKEKKALNEDLFEAIEKGSLADVQKAVANGADPNAMDKNKISAIMHAINKQAGLAIIEFLIKNGADVNIHSRGFVDANYTTPLNRILQVARYPNKIAIVKMLLDNKADPNRGISIKGLASRITPLEEAIYNLYGSPPELIELLLERGADPTPILLLKKKADDCKGSYVCNNIVDIFKGYERFKEKQRKAMKKIPEIAKFPPVLPEIILDY